MDAFDLRFKCPECGSPRFGSVVIGTNPNGPLHRSCHGSDKLGRRCKFNWGEHEDWKYFHHNGRYLTQEEHKQVVEALAKIAVPGAPYPGCTLPGADGA